ncbi:MAG TPA: TonB-dependent receptor [Steroidobacteraceae bacterium]|nr:TonB-dependent receptor [Steroidobacteraceae bacterium]
MSTSNSIRHAVRFALLTSAAAAAVPAYSADQTIQEIVVTGSRIAQPNLETSSPVTQVTSEDVVTQGVTKIEDLINQLPQAFAAQNATVSNGAAGTATVNLRGLGSARTLVLIDGRRMPYGGVTNSAADLNQIPTAMVERVEVLTGGASAVYGSDAIAGVVNFIMKKDFEGVQIDGQYDLYQHNNDFSGPGRTQFRDVIAQRSATNPQQFALPDDNVTDGNGVSSTLTIGVSTEDGRGNITAYAMYQDNKAILQRDRDFSACALGGNPTTNSPTGSFTCGGSTTAFPGQFTQDFENNFTLDSGTGNTFRPFNDDTDQYNFGPTNYYMRPQTRYSLGAMGHYELAPFADVYTQLMFSDVESVAQVAPGGAFIGDVTSINCDNPLMSAQQKSTLGCTQANIDAGDSVTLFIGRRNVEGGGRQQAFHNSSFRALVGTRGDIAQGWNYDVSVQFSRTDANQTTLNFFATDRLKKSLDVVDLNGVPTCRSALPAEDPRFDGNADANCVPYNVFQIGGVTQAALNYVQAPGLQQGTIDQNIVTGVITGDLGTIGAKLPWADEAIKVAFGVENRRDKLTNTTDALQASDGLSGAGGAVIGISGSTNVNDAFMEANIPLVQGKPFAEQLAFDTAYRYSDYNSGIKTDTYKFGLEWAPIEDVRLRGSYQRAVRAPNIVELFTAQGFGLFDMDGDPCGEALAGTAAAASREACLATGVPAANFQSSALDSPANQYNRTGGGNTALKPEESDTYSYGVVLTPRFAPGLSLSLDYFDIKIDQLISVFGAQNTLDACYQLNDPAACGRIDRNALGQLWIGDGNVQDLNLNVGGLETSGVDLNLNYTGIDIGSWGSLSANLTATYLIDIITDLGTPGSTPFDCAGEFAGRCVSSLTTAVNPEFRSRLRFGWETPWNVDVALTHRYISAVDQQGAAATRIDRHLGAESYFDLFASWNVTDMAQMRLGINNVLDNDPSINASVGNTGNGNTYPQVYDALGRFIFGGVTVKF